MLRDRKPSDYLRHLRSLAGTTLGDESVIREIWMRRLPQDVQRILMVQLDLPLDKVAQIADAIMDSSLSPESAVRELTKTEKKKPSQIASRQSTDAESQPAILWHCNL